MEGPRAVRIEELPSLSRLVDTVFMNGVEGAMFGYFPLLFHVNNLENCLVSVESGDVVSHFGMMYRYACIDGCTVKLAMVGAVSTYEQHRGRGLATEMFRAARAKALADGVDFMMISGDRSLYSRAGAAEVGLDAITTVDANVAKAIASRNVTVAPIEAAGLDACVEAYNRRRARFVRPREEWDLLMRTGCAWCQDVDVVAVLRRDHIQGYFVVGRHAKDGIVQIIEHAGVDDDLAAALRALQRQRKCKGIHLRLQTEDHRLKTLLEGAGASFQTVPTVGTFLILNFAQLMEKLRPRIAARIGTDAATTIRFNEQEGRLAIAAGQSACIEDRAGMARLLFGHRDLAPVSGLLGRILPIPTLWYGTSYT